MAASTERSVPFSVSNTCSNKSSWRARRSQQKLGDWKSKRAEQSLGRGSLVATAAALCLPCAALPPCAQRPPYLAAPQGAEAVDVEFICCAAACLADGPQQRAQVDGGGGRLAAQRAMAVQRHGVGVAREQRSEVPAGLRSSTARQAASNRALQRAAMCCRYQWYL